MSKRLVSLLVLDLKSDYYDSVSSPVSNVNGWWPTLFKIEIQSELDKISLRSISYFEDLIDSLIQEAYLR